MQQGHIYSGVGMAALLIGFRSVFRIHSKNIDGHTH